MNPVNHKTSELPSLSAEQEAKLQRLRILSDDDIDMPKVTD